MGKNYDKKKENRKWTVWWRFICNLPHPKYKSTHTLKDLVFRPWCMWITDFLEKVCLNHIVLRSQLVRVKWSKGVFCNAHFHLFCLCFAVLSWHIFWNLKFKRIGLNRSAHFLTLMSCTLVIHKICLSNNTWNVSNRPFGISCIFELWHIYDNFWL